mmetsp:Transcript_20074/g.19687  ORF Transcript_20074/g.19687 Transcript_20074/m.19687 type:complete len:179 (-) Transcript_20074:9-545(-)
MDSSMDDESNREGLSQRNPSSEVSMTYSKNSTYSTAAGSKHQSFTIVKNKNKVYANTTIFALDSRLLCESYKENKIKTTLRCNKGQLVRLIRHSSKHQYWAILNSYSKFGPKAEVELIDSRILMPDLSEYPVGKYKDPHNKSTMTQTYPVLSLAYLKRNITFPATVQYYLQGNEDEIV